MKKKKISILGCGWLGLPLAKTLVAKGFNIKGSTTSISKLNYLKSLNINPFLVELSTNSVSENIKAFLDASETLIINIPPGLRKNPHKNHVQEIKNLMAYTEESTIKNIVYISSTSVFQDTIPFSIVNENTKPNAVSNSSQQLIAIETMLQTNPRFNTTILRFSGLFDEDRHPGKILSGRKNIANPEAPVNLIHKEDCISIILKLIKHNFWNDTFNASFPQHPTKEEYYTTYCKNRNLELPEFDETKPSKGKIIDTSKLAQLLKYEYKTGL